MPIPLTFAMAEAAAPFFFSFARLESALKESAYWQSDRRGVVSPAWNCFIQKHEAKFALDDASKALLYLAPMTQSIHEDGEHLDWRPLSFDDDASNLKKVVVSLKTVRNNLFHGGKTGTDDERRTVNLLQTGRQVIEVLATLDARVATNYRGRT